MSLHKVVLLLGTNIGNKEENLQRAIAKIEKQIGKVSFFSAREETAPVEFESPHSFYNIALFMHTDFSPFQLLKEIKKIENDMGRIQDSSQTGGYEDRIIDIDIVSYNNIRFWSGLLEIPHQKHLFERAFSKKLLAELHEKSNLPI